MPGRTQSSYHVGQLLISKVSIWQPVPSTIQSHTHSTSAEPNSTSISLTADTSAHQHQILSTLCIFLSPLDHPFNCYSLESSRSQITCFSSYKPNQGSFVLHSFFIHIRSAHQTQNTRKTQPPFKDVSAAMISMDHEVLMAASG